MRLRFMVEDRASGRLEELAGKELSEARARLIDTATREALEATVRFNPVDTGRARAAWVSALTALGGEAPAGWQGPHPDGAAIAEGRGLGGLERQDEESTTATMASSGVPYVNYLEYGTSKMGAFAMVRRALVQVQQSLKGWFRLAR